MANLNYIFSLLSIKKVDFSKAFLHARLHVKLSYRVWTMIDSQQSKHIAGNLIGDELCENDGDDIIKPMSTLVLAKPDSPSDIPPTFSMQHNVPLWSTVRRLFHGLAHLSQLFAHWGLFSEARYYMEQGLKIAEAAQAPSLRGQALGYLGDYFTRNGDIEQGISFLRQAENIRHNLHIDPSMVILQIIKANCYTQKGDNKFASDSYDHAGRILEQLQTHPFVKQSTSQANSAHDLSAEMSQLCLHEGPSTRRLQSQRKAASQSYQSKSVARVKTTNSREINISSSGVSILSSLKATVLQQRASRATSMHNFELATALLVEAANIAGMPQDLVFNRIEAGKLHLRKAIESMAADPVFCVLPESTTSQPSISAARGRPGTVASERSPKTKVPRSPSRGAAVRASRDMKAKQTASPLRFAEFLGQAHEHFMSVYEQAKTACSTAIVHSVTDLLTRTIVMLSASVGSQAKGAASTLFALYIMGKLGFQYYDENAY